MSTLEGFLSKLQRGASTSCWIKNPEEAPEWFKGYFDKEKDRATASRVTDIEQIDPDLLKRIQDDARANVGMMTMQGYAQ